MLLLGCAVSQLRGDLQSLMDASSIGYALVVAQCTISAVAAVFSEKLLKETHQSIHLQNLQLYVYGVLFSLLNMYVEGVEMRHWLRVRPSARTPSRRRLPNVAASVHRTLPYASRSSRSTAEQRRTTDDANDRVTTSGPS